MNVTGWAERVLKTVDSETGHSVARVRLASVEGQTWETWDAPFVAPADFVIEVQTVLDALAEEWPKKKIQVLLIATDAQGTEVSQCPLSIWGKNKDAGNLFSNDGSRALAEGMDHIVRTTERLLGTVNNQMRQMSEFQDKLVAANHDLIDYVRHVKESEALASQESREVTSQLVQGIKENMPLVLGLLEKVLGGSPGAAKVLNGAKVVAAATQAAASNGATGGE